MAPSTLDASSCRPEGPDSRPQAMQGSGPGVFGVKVLQFAGRGSRKL